ncbi:MAG: tetratricopeptide repeat protein [Tannerella sp.]|jgi:tetratricopeptide (TPR) repeat protein|nr:tetratricopeptide repeat protein [Tannerella sp.]
MKRVLVMIGLSVAATAVFAQKKAVSETERIIKDKAPNYDEARNLIKGALENEETKDDAKTWYVAGQVEDTQFNAENMKLMLGQQPNEPLMYDALEKGLPYFIKAYDLDQLPNEKGKVKPKFDKKIKGILNANQIYFLNAGGYYFEKQDYKKAHSFFEQYLQIADLPFMQGEKAAVRDTNFMTVQFYNAVVSTQLGDQELSIKNLKRAKDTPFRQYDIYQWLFSEYQTAKDTANMENTLREAMTIFPDSSYFTLWLIDLYIATDKNDEAINLLDAAIAGDADNPQLYYARGTVYERGLKDYAKAEVDFLKQVELEPESAIANSNIGRIYYNQGVTLLQDANLIQDVKQYNEEKNKALDLFRKAMPYYQKANGINPNETEYLTALRGIYYNLDMGKEFDEIDALMNKEN